MKQRAFTLIELLIVMVIIGILIAFILKASVNGVRRAEEKATIALIAKLEQAMTDRIEALSTYRPDPVKAHLALAGIYHGSNPRIDSVQRAQAIAQFDFMRAQLPDVFVVQNATGNGKGEFPLNFGGQSYKYPGTTSYTYAVPLGADNGTEGIMTGNFGAAFEISSGIYKQLGYGPKGYDGNDNDGNDQIDDRFEGEMDFPAAEKAAMSAQITARLQRHTHKTARSEMLYAILVEGGGVYGSAFDKDDFTSKEVQDTDGDGLMEFVDAWGEPLQFYRWPVLYHSDGQKGFPDTTKLGADADLAAVVATVKPGPYVAQIAGTAAVSYDSREQNPLDPNQTLVAPAWWGAKYNDSAPAVYQAGSGNISGTASEFMKQFGPCLVDPIAMKGGAPSPTFWDRSSAANPDSTGPIFYRRAYYSRFLILSGGPDKEPGVARLYDPKDKVPANYRAMDDRSTYDIPGGVATSRDTSGGVGNSVSINVGNSNPDIAGPKLVLESMGGRVDLNRADVFGTPAFYGANGRNDTNSQLEYYGQDDITSHNLQSTGGVLQ